MGYKFARIHWRGRHSYPQGPLLPERSQSWFASFTLPTRWFQTSFSTHSDDHRPLTEAQVLKAGNSTKGEKEHDGLEAMVVGRRKFWLEILRNCKRSLWTSQLIPDGSHWGLGGRVEAATLSHEQGTRHVPSRASSCLPPRPARPAHSVSDNLIYSLTSEMTPPYIFLLLHLKNGLLWFRFFFFFFASFANPSKSVWQTPAYENPMSQFCWKSLIVASESLEDQVWFGLSFLSLLYLYIHTPLACLHPLYRHPHSPFFAVPTRKPFVIQLPQPLFSESFPDSAFPSES